MTISIRLVLMILVAVVVTQQAFGFGRGAAVGGMKVGPRGVTGGHVAHGVSTGPLGGVHAGSSKGFTHTGPRGVTIQHGTVGGVSKGPLGGMKVGSVTGTKITGPNGKTYTTLQGGGAKVGPLGGVAVGGGSGTSIRGPLGGGVSVGNRSGVAVGPLGGVRVGSSSGVAVRGPLGSGAAIGTRSGVTVGPLGGVRVGHSTGYINRTTLRTTGVSVRTGFVAPVFTPSWYSVNRSAWVASKWYGGYSMWRPVVWASLATFLAITTPPVVYDYGTSVVIVNGDVYVNGSRVTSAPEYAQQASVMVETGRIARPAENDEWQPLGVFGLIQGQETVAQRIIQLAVNKDGIIRGNYYDTLTDSTVGVVGSVDKKNQRMAWSIGTKKEIVFETGLNNLTEAETVVLVHVGKESTQQMILVRLEEPQGEKK